ncbi:uncharacterized protein LOC125648962 isoform X2 [Ostrea edulis]|uniref:uncharacterized protein LOC125648962 isoform X2 n=1 Tax=Ostrea edulis TaxID=37623 RepID=UPI0024AEC560|nr:uncharacterized protein LOC125648962 isoform X2 [Ostrea edulis]
MPEKMWNTQYMEDFNKKRTRTKTKTTPTESWRYSNQHQKKESLDLRRPKTAGTNSWYIKKAQKNMEERSRASDVDSPFIDSFSNMLNDAHNPYQGTFLDNYVSPYPTPYPSRQQTPVPPSDLQISGEKIMLNNREIPKQYLIELYEAAMDKKMEEEEKGDEEKPEEKREDEVDKGPVVEQRPKTPAQEPHWICWPEPECKTDLPKRPNTVLGVHGPDVADIYKELQESSRGAPLTFVPELHSWVNATTDYDRETAARLMAMSGSLAPPLPPEALRPQRQATFTFGNNRKNMYRTVPDPRGFYAQSWMPYYEDRNASDDRRVREMDKRLAMSDTLPQLPMLQRSNTYTDMRPMQRRVIRYPKSEEYVHEHSMFMTTQPLIRGHFIIHPDWVSERLTKKRMNLANRKVRNGLRYGTSEEY